MSEEEYSFDIEIHDYKEEMCKVDEKTFNLYKVNEKAAGTETFGSFLKRIAVKYNKHSRLIYRLLNGNQLIWKEYFSDEMLEHLSIENIHEDYLYGLGDLAKIRISDLVANFRINEKVILLGINGPDLGADLGNYEGIRFIFHTRETSRHHLKHIHCSYSGEKREIDIVNCKFIGKPFTNRKKSRRALEIVSKNQEQLINYWDEVLEKGHPAPEFKLDF